MGLLFVRWLPGAIMKIQHCCCNQSETQNMVKSDTVLSEFLQMTTMLMLSLKNLKNAAVLSCFTKLRAKLMVKTHWSSISDMLEQQDQLMHIIWSAQLR